MNLQEQLAQLEEHVLELDMLSDGRGRVIEFLSLCWNVRALLKRIERAGVPEHDQLNARAAALVVSLAATKRRWLATAPPSLRAA